jgi:catechol 2,3-dioxygenase-like lactoylglutathione lyase family enzyme
MIKGINHSGIVVADLEQALEFYRDVLGLEVLARRERDGGPISDVVGYDDCHIVIADVGTREGRVLELIQYVNPPPGRRPTEERSVLGGSHVAFNVEDISQTYEDVLRGGAQSLNPPVEVAPGKTVCYMQDPEGNWIELIESSG